MPMVQRVLCALTCVPYPLLSAGETQPFMRTIDFVFDPEIDTADNLAREISEHFNLSSTDTDLCAAALREWLAKEMPESEGQK